MSRDTWAGMTGAPISLNRFAYAGNNPTTLRDPSGHDFELALPFVSGITAALATLTMPAWVAPVVIGGVVAIAVGTAIAVAATIIHGWTVEGLPPALPEATGTSQETRLPPPLKKRPDPNFIDCSGNKACMAAVGLGGAGVIAFHYFVEAQRTGTDAAQLLKGQAGACGGGGGRMLAQ